MKCEYTIMPKDLESLTTDVALRAWKATNVGGAYENFERLVLAEIVG